MGVLEQEKKVIGPGRRPKYTRRLHCKRCDTVLALELTDNLGSPGDYWSIKNGVWTPGRWFGNPVKCPTCRLTGKLPMDKPLSLESILERKEKANAK